MSELFTSTHQRLRRLRNLFFLVFGAAIALVLSIAVWHRPTARIVDAPPIYHRAETIPMQPRDAQVPMGSVLWLLNYDLRPFDETLAWLDGLPETGRRERARGLMALIATVELDRDGFIDPGIDAFRRAEAGIPDDFRIPAWRAFLEFLKVRDDPEYRGGPVNPEILAAIDELRRVGQRYPQFSLFGILAALGGYKNATPEMLVEARDALERVVNLTGDNQFSDDPLEIERLRRVAGDTPIAPYNILAVSAMRGDFALRTGDLEAARRHYYTAIHANHAYRWPWRAEVESRLATMETVRDAFETKPARTFMLCFRAHGDIGVQDAIKDEVYGGRVGNGSCTICHTHVSTFDLPAMHANASAEPAPQIGWIRGRIAAPADIRQPVPTVFALPKPSESEIPTGFYIGLTLPPGVNPEFYRDDSLYRGEFVLPAKPGDVYVAARLRGKTTQQKEGMLKGLAKTRIGLPWAIPVEAGKVTDIREHPITLIAH